MNSASQTTGATTELTDGNPYRFTQNIPQETGHARRKTDSDLSHALAMLLIPIGVAAATMVVNGLLKHQFPQIDERYLCLFMGVPWSLTAWSLALRSWFHGHRANAVVGGVFWTLCGLFAAWVTIGFWNG